VRRILVIVNPYATAVTPALRDRALQALAGAYEVEAVQTEAPGHAVALATRASAERWDAVAAFGGDGTVNEVANGLTSRARTTLPLHRQRRAPLAVPAGFAVPSEAEPASDDDKEGEDGLLAARLRRPRPPAPALVCIPGGQANVLVKMLGLPATAERASAHLASLAGEWPTRRMDLGVVNGRRFTFSSGVGVDARVTQAVDAHPRLKARFGAWYYTWAALSIVARHYLAGAPRMAVRVPAPPGSAAQASVIEGITTVVQNGSPFTYFRNRPVEVSEDSRLDSASLAGAVLRRARPLDVPSLARRALSSRASIARHRQVSSFADARELTVSGASGLPLPLHVDGDYLGEVAVARYAVLPSALEVLIGAPSAPGFAGRGSAGISRRPA